MSVSYYDDDKPIAYPTLDGLRIDVGDDEEHAIANDDEFREQVISAQRLVVSRMLGDYVNGSMPVNHPNVKTMTPEKLFAINRMMTWKGGDPVEIADECRKGRVRMRVDAAMSVGKSTKLAPYLARELQYRVLYIAPNAVAIQQAAVYMQSVGLGKFSRGFSDRKQGRLQCMTYGDFCAANIGSSRSVMFQNLDLIVMDESFLGTGEVAAAKRIFSVCASATVSLLVCSATLKVGSGEEAAESKFMGSFHHVKEPVSLEVAIESGKLIAEYLVDRTLVLYPTDAGLMMLAEHYAEGGVDVKVLDSARDYEDVIEVVEWLSGDAVTPRVVVAHESMNIGFNFPVAYEVLWPYRAVSEVVGQTLVEKLVPYTEEMVKQAMARTGRGIVEGSGGIVMSPERSATTDLYESDRVRAFTWMYANSIAPMKNAPQWRSAYELFPGGLVPAQANMLLKSGLPVEVTARYLAKDGYIAKRYAHALNFFCQPDHGFSPSDFELPVNHSDWPEQELVSCVDAGVKMKVPLLAEGEMRVILQGIEQIASGELVIDRWRPARAFAFNDGYDSEEDYERPRYARGPRLRRVEKKEEIPQAVDEVVAPWSFKSQDGWRDRRSGLLIDADRFTEAVQVMSRSIKGYEVPASPGLVAADNLDPKSPALVESPGGSVVCRIDYDTAVKLNSGALLGYGEIVEVVSKAKPNVSKFVASRLFDAFSNPWDSVLDTLVDGSVVSELVARGMAPSAYAVVSSLQARFSAEVMAVLANSNVFRTTYEKLFSKAPTTSAMMKAIRNGKFSRVAQTRGFLNRVVEIKTKIDQSLLFAETKGVYLPAMITAAQRGVPTQRSVVGRVGHNLAAMPVDAGGTLRRIGGGPRGFITDF